MRGGAVARWAGPQKKSAWGGDFWRVGISSSAVSSHNAMCKQQLASCPRFVRHERPLQHVEAIGEGVVSNSGCRDPIVRALAPHRAPFSHFHFLVPLSSGRVGAPSSRSARCSQTSDASSQSWRLGRLAAAKPTPVVSPNCTVPRNYPVKSVWVGRGRAEGLCMR